MFNLSPILTSMIHLDVELYEMDDSLTMNPTKLTGEGPPLQLPVEKVGLSLKVAGLQK